MHSLKNPIIIYIFILILGFFVFNQQFSVIEDLDYNENKAKALKPELNIAWMKDYPKQFEDYYRDNFSLRGFFLRYMGWIYSHIWDKSPKPDKVIVGQNGWLFSVDKELDCYYGERSYNEEQLNLVLREFQYRKRILDSMGIKMCIAIHPTKYSIYPEKLPLFLNSGNSSNSATQLIRYFKDNSDINIFYSKDLLLSLKSENNILFFRGDNHWTDQAGCYVAQALVNHIDPEIPKIPIAEFCRDTLLNVAGNLAHMMANAADFSETKIVYKLCKNDAEAFQRFEYPPPENVSFKSEYQMSFRSANPSLPNAVIIRDSFGHALIPYLKNSFYHSTFIWDNWEYGFNLDIIKKEEADVVIYMVLESLIPNIYESGLSKNWR